MLPIKRQRSSSQPVTPIGDTGRIRADAGRPGPGHRLMGVGKQIEIGNTYLMFLHHTTSADCFTVVKLWEIRNGIA
jgi:hypothetical protein